MPPIASDNPLVLIVDDVPDNLSMLSDALDEAGFVVLVATDGPSAIERTHYITPDIILLDAVMPGMDGFETCRQLKERLADHEVPIIFMTGLAETEHVVRGFQAGGIDYVTKPIHPDAVIARIHAHLRSAQVISMASAAVDAAPHGVVVLDAQGRALWRTRKAQGWLEKYFSLDTQDHGTLPDAIRIWIEQQIADEHVGGGTNNITRFVSGGHELMVEFISAAKGSQHMLRLEELVVEIAPGERASYHLTTREAEVLSWLAKGKTNRDIGEILGMSPRTVNKHLEHIYVKLGVENRAAATAIAIRHVGATSSQN